MSISMRSFLNLLEHEIKVIVIRICRFQSSFQYIFRKQHVFLGQEVKYYTFYRNSTRCLTKLINITFAVSNFPPFFKSKGVRKVH